MRSPRLTFSTFSTFSTTSALMLAVACRGPDLGSASDTTGGSSASSEETSGEPTSGDETSASGSGGDSTTGDPTTGVPGDAVTRILYSPFVLVEGESSAAELRLVEIVDGVPSPPVTILDPPGARLITRDSRWFGPWSPVYSGPEAEAQLWLVDLAAMTPHEIPLPAEVRYIDDVQLSRDDSHLIVRAAPEGSDAPEDMLHYTCALGPAGQCALVRVEAATGPSTFVSYVFDVSSSSGRIWYETMEVGGTETHILQGEALAPEQAATLVTLPDLGWIQYIARDESALFFTKAAGNDLYALDIGQDPPPPPVEVFPPLLPGQVQLKWSSDDSSLLVLSHYQKYGELYRVAVDGATVGPLQSVGGLAPGHVPSAAIMWSKDEAAILFKSDHESPGRAQLYRVDDDTPEGPPVRISAPLGATGEVGLVKLGGDPNHVIYSLVEPAGSRYYRARLDPPGEVHPLSAEGDAPYGYLDVSDDGARAVYTGDPTASRLEIFFVEIEGGVPSPSVLLTESLPANLEVGLVLSTNEDFTEVFFEANDRELPVRDGLYMARPSHLGELVRLSDEGEPVWEHRVVRPQ